MLSILMKIYCKNKKRLRSYDSDPDSYPVTILVFLGVRRLGIRLRRARGLVKHLNSDWVRF